MNICSHTNLVSVILVSGWEERRYFVLQVEQIIPVEKLCSFVRDLVEILQVPAVKLILCLLVVLMLVYDQGGGEGGEEGGEDGDGGEAAQ